uniref:Actin-binding protein IPP n=1 Tax=Elaeis guineensis var. tenera TaxID=51953 RepID=A0A6I9R667_ELAGV|nr:actin-binding protein IPP [Elaeis guineensis]XP_010921051.1 actin-binding protein IPP [Elaeis guineensis]
MGRGKKTQTIIVPERPPWSPTGGNSSTTARNLRKSDLGGVIFGCTHNTMKECLSNQLFGLPSLHFSYVKNIEPGLPLFLFNYTDRKMHGIYEAASHGQMNIDPYAWTDNGMQRTPFPAQVHIYIKMPCQPLLENQYKKVIGDNYYTVKHFWFDLDHAQTRGLISLFAPSASVKLAPGGSGKTNPFTSFPSTKLKAIANMEHANNGSGEPRRGSTSPADLLDMNMFSSFTCDDGDREHASSSRTSTSAPEEREHKEPVSDWEDWDDSVQGFHPDVSVRLDEQGQSLSEHHFDKESKTAVQGMLHKLRELAAEHRQSTAPSKESINDGSIRCTSTNILQENRPPEDNLVSAKIEENTTVPDLYQKNAELVHIINELTKKTAAMEEKQTESDKEIQHLRDVIEDSGRKIQQLKHRVEELESKLNPSKCLVDDISSNSAKQYWSSEKVIYLIGGFNGTSWLSALDLFSPSKDTLIPLKQMGCARSYAAAAALNDNIFVFGGGDGNSWFHTVECYNQRNDEWTMCPHMNCAKGSLAGVTLNDKIYAIGGGDGYECFSDVEMFDPVLERWIGSQSMFQKRFAPAAAELQGVLYAVGGYDGRGYLLSAESYDPREGLWTRLPSMNTRRGCHSLSVFNGKLYVTGGYDGEKMVSSVETFDPRLGAWMIEEPMNVFRGYAAAAVLGETLFVVGGLKDGETILDTVESYNVGTGWSMCGFKAIGKRCFFSAIVL